MDKRVLVGAVVGSVIGGTMVVLLLLAFLVAVPVMGGRGSQATATVRVQRFTVDSEATRQAQETEDRLRKLEQDQKCAAYKSRRTTSGFSGGYEGPPVGCY